MPKTPSPRPIPSEKSAPASPLRALIPHWIDQQYAAGQLQGEFEAAALFVDISGFTALTETLMEHHKDGTEVLTDVLNRTFGPLVKAVYQNGGMISTFAGDAFTAVFPLHQPDAVLHATQMAFFARQFFVENGSHTTPYGPFTLSAKCGLGLGTVQWGIPGQGDERAYFLRGAGIDACAGAEHFAAPGEMFATEAVIAALGSQVAAVPAAGGYFRLVSQNHVLPARRIHLPALSRERLLPFVPSSVLDLHTPAEFRDVTAVFVSFSENIARDSLNRLMGQILQTATAYGGYFNKLDFGDKGGLALVLFGAPVAHENDLYRASEFLLTLREFVSTENGQQTPILRAGLALGTVYAGFIGGKERSEYTVIGDMVNLAARLAQQADWGEIWLSEAAAVRLQKSCFIHPLGEYRFKGIREMVPAYRLESRRSRMDALSYRGAMIGRALEMDQIQAFMTPALEGRFAGLLTVFGEAGIGKSRLLNEYQRALQSRSKTYLLWMTGVCDQTLQQPLNPFRYLLRVYFDQSADASEAENLHRFDYTLDDLIADLQSRSKDSSASHADEISRDLQRARPFLQVLTGLPCQDPIYEQLEPRLRFENMLRAFKTLIQAESMRSLVVLVLEDAHWLDADSRQMLQTLTRNIKNHPLAVICASRMADDGSKIDFGLDGGVPQTEIELHQWQPSETGKFAAHILPQLASPWKDIRETPVSVELIDFLTEKTNGNPFFVEQILMYLLEHALIQVEQGGWVLVTGQLIEVPTDINQVLLARLDRLKADVKRVVQTASVLGLEFDVHVLSQMLKQDHQLLEKVHQAEAEAIWLALNEIRYLFKHALLRDVAYEMQLRSHLRDLHALAAQAVESIYRADLRSYYADLAYHSEHADDRDAAARWHQLAGEQAADLYANDRAIQHLKRALELTPPDQTAQRYTLHMACEQVYDRSGKRVEQKQVLDALKDLSAHLELEQQIQITLRESRYANAISEFHLSQTLAEQATEQARENQLINLQALGLLYQGHALRRLSDLTTALERFEQGLVLARQAERKDLQAEALLGMGSSFINMGEFNRSREVQEQALLISREAGSLIVESKALNDLGVTLGAMGDVAVALDYYGQYLHISRETGGRRNESIALYNISTIHISVGDFAAASQYLEQTLGIAREIGDRFVELTALHTLGEVLAYQKQYPEAYQYLMEALPIADEIGSLSPKGLTLCHLGHTLSALGRGAEARAAYLQAVETQCEADEEYMSMEALAGMARLAAAENQPQEALQIVERILAFLGDDITLDGVDQPFRVYLTCVQILRQHNDPRAESLLQKACALLEEQAAEIHDEAMHRSFLENMEWHRELAALGKQAD